MTYVIPCINKLACAKHAFMHAYVCSTACPLHASIHDPTNSKFGSCTVLSSSSLWLKYRDLSYNWGRESFSDSISTIRASKVDYMYTIHWLPIPHTPLLWILGCFIIINYDWWVTALILFEVTNDTYIMCLDLVPMQAYISISTLHEKYEVAW